MEEAALNAQMSSVSALFASMFLMILTVITAHALKEQSTLNLPVLTLMSQLAHHLHISMEMSANLVATTATLVRKLVFAWNAKKDSRLMIPALVLFLQMVLAHIQLVQLATQQNARASLTMNIVFWNLSQNTIAHSIGAIEVLLIQSVISWAVDLAGLSKSLVLLRALTLLRLVNCTSFLNSILFLAITPRVSA